MTSRVASALQGRLAGSGAATAQMCRVNSRTWAVKLRCQAEARQWLAAVSNLTEHGFLQFWPFFYLYTWVRMPQTSFIYWHSRIPYVEHNELLSQATKFVSLLRKGLVLWLP